MGIRPKLNYMKISSSLPPAILHRIYKECSKPKPTRALRPRIVSKVLVKTNFTVNSHKPEVLFKSKS